MRKEWDLMHLYPNYEAWEKDLKSLLKLVSCYQKDSLNKDNLLDKLNYLFDLSQRVEKIWVYPRRKMDLNAKDELAKEKFEEAFAINQKIESLFFHMERELKQSDNLLTWALHQDAFKEYSFYFHELQEQKSHVVDENDEEIVKNCQKEIEFVRTWYRGLESGFITINGEKIALNQANLAYYLKHENRSIRKRFYGSYFLHLKKQNEDYVKNLLLRYENEMKLSQVKKYSSLQEFKLKKEGLPVTLLEDLFAVTKNHFLLLKRYYDVLKKRLGLEKLEIWDIQLPMFKIGEEKEYSFLQAKNIILKSLESFPTDYTKLLEEKFYDGSFDVIKRNYKRTNSYTTITFAGVPYICTNYTKKFESINTIAHELGHAMHVSYAKQKGFLGFDFPYGVAEIPSKLHELFLNQYCIKHAKTKNEKISFLEKHLKSILNTIFYTTRYQEFEYRLIEALESKEVVTDELVNKISKDLMMEYYKDCYSVDDLVSYDHQKSPFFYLQEVFTNYQYPYSLAISINLFYQLQNGLLSYETYVEFLRVGRRKTVMEQLKMLQIDLHSNEFWETSFRYFEELMIQLEQLLEDV